MEVAKSYLLSFTPFLFEGKSYIFKFHVLKSMAGMHSVFNMDYWLFSHYDAKETLLTEKARRVIRKKKVQVDKQFDHAQVFTEGVLSPEPIDIAVKMDIHTGLFLPETNRAVSFKEGSLPDVMRRASTIKAAVVGEPTNPAELVSIVELEQYICSVIKPFIVQGYVDVLLNTEAAAAKSLAEALIGADIVKFFYPCEVDKYRPGAYINKSEIEIQEFLSADNIHITEFQKLINATLREDVYESEFRKETTTRSEVVHTGEVQQSEIPSHGKVQTAELIEYLNTTRGVEELTELLLLTQANKLYLFTGEAGILSEAVVPRTIEGTVSEGFSTVELLTPLFGDVNRIHTVAYIGRFGKNEILPNILEAFNSPSDIGELVEPENAQVLDSVEVLIDETQASKGISGGGVINVTLVKTGKFRATEVVIDKDLEKIYVLSFEGVNENADEKAVVISSDVVTTLVPEFSNLATCHGKQFNDDQESGLAPRPGYLLDGTDESDLGLHHGKLYEDGDGADLGLHHGKLYVDGGGADLGLHHGKLYEDMDYNVVTVARKADGTYTFDKSVLNLRPGVSEVPEQSDLKPRIADQYGTVPEDATLKDHKYEGVMDDIDKSTIKDHLYISDQPEGLEDAVVPEKIYESNEIQVFTDVKLSKKNWIKEAVYTMISPFFKKKKRMRIDDEGISQGPPKPPPQPNKMIWLIQGKAQSWHLWPRRKTR